MSLRAKVFLLIGSILAVFFLVIDLSLSNVLTDDFSALEEREMKENIFRATNALTSRVEELSVKLSDWAQWDDTYEYIRNPHEKYIQSNLVPESFGPLRINCVVLIDEHGQVVFERYVQDGVEVVFPKSLEDHLVKNGVFGQINTGDIRKEIVNFPEGIMVLVSRSITSSDGLADPRGTITFGFVLTEEIVQELSQLVHLKLSTSLYDDDADAGFVEAKRNLSFDDPYFIGNVRSPETLSGYTLISDAERNPVLILRVDTGREIYQKGQVSISLFRKLLIFSGFAFALIIFFVLKYFVLNKISYLSQEVVRVRQSGNPDTHIWLPGKDEFASLAQEIDSMLISIREIEAIRKEGEKRFRTVADAAPVMIWMADTEQKFTYVNKVWLDFTGKSLSAELGRGWEENIHPDDREKGRHAFETAFNRRIEFQAECRLKAADGQYRWIFVRGIPQLSSSGKDFIGYIGSCIDITERREADQKKEEYIAEIERMNTIMVSRELKMIELKEKIRNLENQDT